MPAEEPPPPVADGGTVAGVEEDVDELVVRSVLSDSFALLCCKLALVYLLLEADCKELVSAAAPTATPESLFDDSTPPPDRPVLAVLGSAEDLLLPPLLLLSLHMVKHRSHSPLRSGMAEQPLVVIVIRL